MTMHAAPAHTARRGHQSKAGEVTEGLSSVVTASGHVLARRGIGAGDVSVAGFVRSTTEEGAAFASLATPWKTLRRTPGAPCLETTWCPEAGSGSLIASGRLYHNEPDHPACAPDNAIVRLQHPCHPRGMLENSALEESSALERTTTSSGPEVAERLYVLVEAVSRLAGPVAFVAALGGIVWLLLK